MTRLRKALIALGIVAAVAVAAVYLVLSGLDRIVAAAIEKFGSETTGTRVTVSSVRIRLTAGEGSIRGLTVGNPEGFSAPSALRLENITVALKRDSVTRNPVVIERVLVRGLGVTYEIGKSGESNVDVIRERIEKSQATGTSRESRSAGGGKRVVIRVLVIEDGVVNVQAAALSGKPLSAALPRIELRNLGGRRGDSPGAIARQIAVPLVAQASLAVSRAGISRSLGTEAGMPGAVGQKAVHDVEEWVKKMLGK